jgi:hypothetical protein
MLKRRHAKFLSDKVPNYRPGALLSEPGLRAFPSGAFRKSIFTGSPALPRGAATGLAFSK